MGTRESRRLARERWVVAIHVFECPQCHETLAAEGEQDEFSVECSGCHIAVLVKAGGNPKTCTCGAELIFGAGIRPGVSIPCPQCSAPVTASGEVVAARVLPRLEAPADGPKLRLRSGSTTGRPCPSCRTMVAEDVVLCTNCGLNFRTGRKVRARMSAFAFPAIPWSRIAMLLVLVALGVVGYARRKEIQPFVEKNAAEARAWFARFSSGEVEPAPPAAVEAAPAAASAAGQTAPLVAPPAVASPAEPDPVPASTSEGLPCAACGGRGKVSADCRGCICSQCGGRRATACATCRGQKATACPACRGMKFGPDEEVRERCGACRGFGTIQKSASGLQRKDRWGNVVRQTVSCPTCKGSGLQTRLERTYCRSCSGRGYETCKACSGAGTATCPRCNGAGLMPTCSACGGTRRAEAPCAACGGSGKAKAPTPVPPVT